MKSRSTPILLIAVVCSFALTDSAEAKNRHSLLGKVINAFKSDSGSENPETQRTVRPVNERIIASPTQPNPGRPSAGPTMPAAAPAGVDPVLFEMRRRAEALSKEGLRYKFGGDSPSEGGMDCSGTMMHLLGGMGVRNVPRTSYAQYAWVKENGNLRRKGWGSSAKAYQNLKAGDLIFWGKTYNSGHKVSHVMLYLGRAADGRHFMFGARGKKSRGVNGSGVDIFEFTPGASKNLVGYGSVPGLGR